MEERRGGSVADRIAAVEFFFAIGTLEALRVILGTGIMAQGSPLRSTAQAAAGLAAWLAQSDADAVVEELFGVCEIREIGTKRMLAIAGLQSLADRHLIPPSAVARLGLVAQDPSLPSYAIAAAIWATSCYPEASQLPDFVAFLRRHISRSESYLDVRFQCFQSLVRLGMWQEQEETFLDTLDLVGHSRLLPSKPDGYQAWQALLLTQLAIRVPEKFLDAVIDVIDKAGADAVHAVLQVCTRTRDPLGRLLDSVASAAIARALRVFNLFYAETDTLSLVAQLAAGEFIRAEWERVWGNWMPEARAALARAVERSASAFTPDVQPRVLDPLETLLSDSVYQVRRIAARAYAQIDVGKLSDLCQSWSESGNSGLRLRAVEIAQYLPPDGSPSMDNMFLRRLREDPEKRIRVAAADGITKLRNRLWAADLLALIRASRDRQPNEWVAECYRYGRALAQCHLVFSSQFGTRKTASNVSVEEGALGSGTKQVAEEFR